MYGIDISHWDEPIDLNQIGIDFCITKATEGANYVDKTFTEHIHQCHDKHILFGFYHFAGGGDAKKEARFFYDNTKEYVGEGIPCLDFEIFTGNDVKWCEEFIREYYEITRVWCMLYISAYMTIEFENSWIPDKCALWVAGYPKSYHNWTTDEMPYNILPFDCPTVWQFTNQLKLSGHDGFLDGDIAYLTPENWMKIANGEGAKTIEKENVDELANDVIDGKYGYNKERRVLLGAMYDTVQQRVNELFKAANDVINGKYGNGETRRELLEKKGYPYWLVQKIVNNFLL